MEIPDKLTSHINKMMENPISIQESVEIQNDFMKKMNARIIAASTGSVWLPKYLRNNSKELQFEWEKEPLKNKD
jgi:hypothetical protein